MLMTLDRYTFGILSYLLNLLTLGSKGSSLCGRLYLYNQYVSNSNVLVILLMGFIDLFEKDHCYNSARLWRLRNKREGVHFPIEYKEFLL